MSRCYPYPPPGYEKKPHVIELVSSPKKDKHKHKDKDKKDKKDKKKKRRRDNETNGDSSHRDKDKRSKRTQHGGIDEGIRSTNGRPSSDANTTTSAAAHETITIPRKQTDISRDTVLTDGLLIAHRGNEPDGKLGNHLSLIPPAKVASNGTIASYDLVSIKPTSQVEDELIRQEAQTTNMEKVWSAIDDEEWLSLCKPLNQKKNIEEGEVPEVWAEVVYLPSVGIHALPYVVPD